MRGTSHCFYAILIVASALAAWTAPEQVWVDAKWNGPNNCGGHAWQTDAFPAIQAALNAAAEGAVVRVAPGRYAERLTLAKSVYLSGPGDGVNPNAPTAGDPFAANPGRGAAANEAVILPREAPPNVPEGFLITVNADKVMIAGFTLDGNLPPPTSTYARRILGIGNRGRHCQQIIISHNILRNCLGGAICFQNDDTKVPQLQQNIIAYNRIENPPLKRAGVHPDDLTPCAGIEITREIYDVIGNTIFNVDYGVFLHWIAQGDAALFAPVISENVLLCYQSGVFFHIFGDNNLHDQFSNTSPRVMLSFNYMRLLPEGPTVVIRAGVTLMEMAHNSKILISGNDMAGGDAGVLLWNSPSMNAGNAVISGGVIHDTKYGVWITNYYERVLYPTSPTKALLNGVTILNPTVAGVYLSDQARGIAEVSAVITNGTVIRGGPAGILVEGERAIVTFLPGAHSSVDFVGQTNSFITLQNNGKTYPPSVDISTVSFNGKTRREMTEEERTALEAGLTDQLDDPRLGRLY